MNLGSLIETLESIEPGRTVRFEDGMYPADLCSWRGDYCELTLDRGPNIVTVAQLLAKAKAAVGGTFQGYKGGDFVMSTFSPVWADPWGECLYRGIVGVRLDDGELVLAVADLSDYR